jgi:hypothetical protein
MAGKMPLPEATLAGILTGITAPDKRVVVCPRGDPQWRARV